MQYDDVSNVGFLSGPGRWSERAGCSNAPLVLCG